MATEPVTRCTGRPRDASIDARALDAARRLLVDEGFAGTTIQAVADRSGVHASAPYRRWPSRLELIEDAVFAGLRTSEAEPTGDLAHDLAAFLKTYVTTFESPVVRAAMPALFGNVRAGEPPRPPEAWLRISMRPWFRRILAAAPRGAVGADIDADDVFDLLLGAVLVRVVLPAEIRKHPPVERTVDLRLRLMSPPAATATSDSPQPI